MDSKLKVIVSAVVGELGYDSISQSKRELYYPSYEDTMCLYPFRLAMEESLLCCLTWYF